MQCWVSSMWHLPCVEICQPFSGYQKNVNDLIQNNGDFLAILRQLSRSNEGSKEHLIYLLAQNIISENSGWNNKCHSIQRAAETSPQ